MPSLADYFNEFILAGQSISYSQLTNGDIRWPESNKMNQPTRNSVSSRQYKEKAADIFNSLQSKWIFATFDQNPRNGIPDDEESHDTVIRPFLQMGHLNIREETDLVVPTLLRSMEEGTIDWTSGYFSLDRDDQKRLLDSKAEKVRVVCASPQVRSCPCLLVLTNLWTKLHRLMASINPLE